MVDQVGSWQSPIGEAIPYFVIRVEENGPSDILAPQFPLDRPASPTELELPGLDAYDLQSSGGVTVVPHLKVRQRPQARQTGDVGELNENGASKEQA